MQYRQLGSTGMHVSVLGYGASSLGGAFGEIDEADGIRSVHVALDHGINFMDVAPYYGATKAETVLGRALKGIDRSRYYLATKVGQYTDDDRDYSAKRVTRSVDESLQRLNADYIDLIQCHDIEFVKADQIINETLPALHRLKEAGKVRHVGITGLSLKNLRDVTERTASGEVQTILSFCRYTLNDMALLDEIPFYKNKGIGIINAAPTGMGLLTPRGAPPWHPASETIKAGCAKAVRFCQENGINIVELAIQFAIGKPDIATTIVGTASSKEMLDNIIYANRPIDQMKLDAVLDVLAPIHNYNFTRGIAENRDPLIPG